jgi:hypothetical protein
MSKGEHKMTLAQQASVLGERESILDAKAVVIGLLVACGIFAGATVYKLAAAPEKKQARLREFEFTPEPPKAEKFELKEPQRELMRPVIQDQPELAEEDKRPNIQMSTDPKDVEIKEEVVKTRTMEVSPEVDVRVAKLDIQDTMEKADETAADSADALSPVAVLVNEPADVYAYTEPKPRIHKRVALVSAAPRTGATLKISPQQLGDQNAPTVGELGPVDINLFGDGDYLGAIKRSGMETRTAVDAALRWLALHQEPEGWWHAHKWDQEDVRPDGTAGDRSSMPQGGEEHKVGLGSFALLAFMGGGHNLRRGEHRASVIRGMEWLLAQQNPRTGYVSVNMYEHAIATIALCEAVGRSPDERIGLAARRAVDACVAAVAKDGGWRYSPSPPDSDVSVTSWFLQALKTAKLANVKFDHSVFSKGLTFIDQCTDKAALADSTGAVGYQPTEDLNQGGSPALTCAAMVIRQFNGMGVKHPLLCRAAERTRRMPPVWDTKDYYYWYYATYAMHNMGGEHRLWWNRKIRDTLLDHQSKRGHQAGSWNPKGDRWQPSRVYTTALGALCLEVYYRYGEALQSFGTVPNIEELFFNK